jgi:UTP--glucose-1-phosphate uridylyltransferase
VALNPQRHYGVPVISLDPKYYKLIDQMEARFPAGPPSLLEGEQFTVKGDVLFGQGVICRGVVEVANDAAEQLRIEHVILGEGADVHV